MQVLPTQEDTMSSVAPWRITDSPPRESGGPTAGDALIRRLRHPDERAAVIGCVLANVGVLVLALVVITNAVNLLRVFPTLAAHIEEIELFVIAAVLAFPLTLLGRRGRFHRCRGNDVRVSATNLPELHELFVRQCRSLGVVRLPELYVSRSLQLPARAYSVVGGRSAIAVNAELFETDWQKNIDCIAFAIGGALGSLRLGHGRWWLEAIMTHALHIPILRTPVLHTWIYSRDRCAAYLVPDGIRGLLIQGSGKDLLPKLNVAAFIEQSRAFGGFWEWLAHVARERPHLCMRARVLYAAGFFDVESDLARWRAEAGSS
jgi:hypothetical protein